MSPPVTVPTYVVSFIIHHSYLTSPALPAFLMSCTSFIVVHKPPRTAYASPPRTSISIPPPVHPTHRLVRESSDLRPALPPLTILRTTVGSDVTPAHPALSSTSVGRTHTTGLAGRSWRVHASPGRRPTGAGSMLARRLIIIVIGCGTRVKPVATGTFVPSSFVFSAIRSAFGVRWTATVGSLLHATNRGSLSHTVPWISGRHTMMMMGMRARWPRQARRRPRLRKRMSRLGLVSDVRSEER